ncbi:site-specific integrase [Parabacteroides goldsteinii]|uniref:site-specific integrase n=1 Tax=Parabacteroides goldsteinii TaxID=328812 RepID=UPI001CCC75AE|nr:site-specific integrase [Parabacteroides goldsteinii]UBD77562.1 site-specific integrase [Parabacteroides goldsteinii]
MTQNIFVYMDFQVARKREAGKDSTADLYRVVRNRLYRFWKGASLQWTDITAAMVDDFGSSLRAEGLAVNTVNSYLSSFRALCHTALREGLPGPACDPFAGLHLKREETAKRALKIAEVNKVMQADYPGEPSLCEALDLFIFSYLACGIPFVDLAYLTKKNIVGGEIVYYRHKTGALIRVGITPAMRLLLRKYGQKGSPYLFPVLSAGKDGHEAYKTALRKYNSLLVIIGERLHLSVKLTSYVARHSWATEALRQNIPVAVISQAMGHTSEKTTRIYLAQLDQSVLNKANAKITKKAADMFLERA